jgi:hypothetical protein
MIEKGIETFYGMRIGRVLEGIRGIRKDSLQCLIVHHRSHIK